MEVGMVAMSDGGDAFNPTVNSVLTSNADSTRIYYTYVWERPAVQDASRRRVLQPRVRSAFSPRHPFHSHPPERVKQNTRRLPTFTNCSTLLYVYIYIIVIVIIIKNSLPRPRPP